MLTLSSLSVLSGSTALLYGLALALIISHVLAAFLIPSLLIQGVKPDSAAHAVFCYFLQSIGVFLMTVSGIPAIYAVLVVEPLPTNAYLFYLIVFIIGGLIFLWYDSAARTIDAVSRHVPELLFLFTFKVMGFFIIILSLLSIFFTLLSSPVPPTGAWWADPVILLLYGVLLTWCTRHAGLSRPSAVHSAGIVKLEAKKSKK